MLLNGCEKLGLKISSTELFLKAIFDPNQTVLLN